MQHTPGKGCAIIRAALGLSQIELAKHAGIGYATLARFELGTPVRPETVGKVEATLTRLADQRGFRVWFGDRWGVRRT